jgi:hypothetical protein
MYCRDSNIRVLFDIRWIIQEMQRGKIQGGFGKGRLAKVLIEAAVE